MKLLYALITALCCLLAAGPRGAQAEVLNIISTGITGSQTFLNAADSYSWVFSVSGSQTFDSVNAKFALKKGQPSAPAVVELQTANSSFQPTGVVASYSLPASAASNSTFRTETFDLSATSMTLSGNYILTLESAATGSGNDTWYVKDPSASVVFENESGGTISGFSGGGAVPVPEPASWAGALVAVACAGGYLARRRLGRRST